MATVLEPYFETRSGELVTVDQLRARTRQQVWFVGDFLEWCERKGFIRSIEPVLLGRHAIARPVGSKLESEQNLPVDVRRNLEIAKAFYDAK